MKKKTTKKKSKKSWEDSRLEERGECSGKCRLKKLTDSLLKYSWVRVKTLLYCIINTYYIYNILKII